MDKLFSFLSKVIGCDGNCEECRGKTEIKHIQITGNAFQAVVDFEALVRSHERQIEALRAERKAAHTAMWAAVQAATGTEGIEGLSIITDYADIGIAVLKVPVPVKTDAEDARNDNPDGGGDPSFDDPSPTVVEYGDHPADSAAPEEKEAIAA